MAKQRSHSLDNLTAGELVRVMQDGGKRDRRTARKALLARPPAETVPPLVAALPEASDHYTYARFGELLAEIGGDEAFRALKERAFERKYVRTRASCLAKCQHPETEDALIELMTRGDSKQRLAAAVAMARSRLYRAAALYQEAVAANHGVRDLLYGAFMEVGAPYTLCVSALMEPGHPVPDRLACLRILTALPTPFMQRKMNLNRFLERLRQRGTTPAMRQTAAEVLDLMRQEATLLRPAARLGDGTLLRAAAGPGDTGADTLLRASDAGETPEDEPMRPWTRRLPAFFARLFGRSSVQEDQ